MKQAGSLKAEAVLRSPSKPSSTASATRDSLRALKTSLRFLQGIGPARAAQLEALGLRTIEDLLYHLPFRYEDRRAICAIAEASAGDEKTFIGRLIAVDQRYIPRRRRRMLTATLEDESGRLGLVWYRVPPYLTDALAEGRTLLIHGKIETGPKGVKQIVHPEFEVIDPESPPDREQILPVYLRPGGVALKTMRKWVAAA